MTTAATTHAGLLYEDSLPAGTHCSFVLRRGTVLRMTDTAGGANVAALFYNFEDRLERYNFADTLKAQHTAHLTTGCVCYSDMGRILVSLVADSCGWHDPIGGLSDAALVQEKYGTARFQEMRNAMHRNSRDSLLVELGKWGLGKRDLVAPVNFFSRLDTDASGQLSFRQGHSAAGDFVDLRAEMHVLVALSGCPHPMDPAADYAPRDVKLEVFRAHPVAADDPCRLRCPENGRGFTNTERLFAL